MYLVRLFRIDVSKPEGGAEGLAEVSSDMQYLVNIVPYSCFRAKG